MGETFTYFAVTGLINAIVSLGLALYLAITSWRVRIAKYLIYMCLALGIWSTGYFIWQISITHDTALFWTRFLMAGAIFTSISFLHLVMVFLGYDKDKFYRNLLILLYIPCFVWEILNFTPLFVADVVPLLQFEFWPIAGPAYLPYLVVFAVHLSLAFGLLYKRYKHSFGLEKKQAMMLLIGISLTFGGGITNYFLWYKIPIAPWGNGLAAFYSIMAVYAIMRYDLLNARVVVAEIFTGALLILSFINVLLSEKQTEFIFNIVILMIMTVFGVMLVRSVRQEVKRREEVTKLAKSLEQANLRLKELDQQKTEFLSIASHQLRTPLSIIKGYIELIKDGAYGKTTLKMVKTLDDMDASNERLVKLVDEFLNISRIEQGRTKFDFKQCDLRETISSVVKELKEKADEQNRKIVWVPRSTECGANIDEEKIRNVVFNYIDNAFKYSDRGEVKVFLESEDDGWNVIVRDSGLGFGKVDGANFFQKFYRGNNVKGTNVNGTGLGLYVCRKFVEAHSGKVWAKSGGLGKGSEFGFWIPLAFSLKT